ncbi:MAG: hypothetical protein RIF36_26040 [Imperialibacter sp.]|uniref:hypothetical protein n=1 Tax=Imperialibacter sp. TaxID=2038411 RepID=UPI0032EDBC5D
MGGLFRTGISSYEPCFVVQSLKRENLVLSDEEKQMAKTLRIELNKCFEQQVKPFLKSLANKNLLWYETIDSKLKQSVFSESSWRNLPNLSGTYLLSDVIDQDDALSTQFYKDGKWIVSDYFLGAMIKKFGDDTDQIMRALRMFIFHEALHFSFQKLTENTAEGIGRFPKVLERADYEADVWAMFWEYAFSSHYNLTSEKSPQKFFEALHLSAVNTMWAFDIVESDPDEMQLRRIIRYLSLYFNLARILDRKVVDIVSIANQLGSAPIIDIKGLKLKADSEGRIIASFVEIDLPNLAIGVYHSNKVHRLGTFGEAFNVSNLINAFKRRESDSLIQFAKKIWELIK